MGTLLGPRVREVFHRYDRSGDGLLSRAELQKAFKMLGPSLTDEEILGFCADIDSSNDGQVSYKEFAEWIKGGTDAAKRVARAIVTTSEKRAGRIRDAFRMYDNNGDGSLDIDELQKTLKTLGTFTVDEIKRIRADLDTSKDGIITEKEFTDWIWNDNGSKEIVKAKAILAPNDDDGLEAVFYNFCGAGKADMDGKSFLKMCKDCCLVEKDFNEKDVDFIFIQTKGKAVKALDFAKFEMVLAVVAAKKRMKEEDLRELLLESTRLKLQGTKADAVRFHDDTSTYTGTHARRAVEGAFQHVREAAGPPQLTPKKAAAARRAHSPRPGDLPKKVDISKPIDNSELWKVFGTHTAAGRILKRLYADGTTSTSPPPSTTPSPARTPISKKRLAQSFPQAYGRTHVSMPPSTGSSPAGVAAGVAVGAGVVAGVGAGMAGPSPPPVCTRSLGHTVPANFMSHPRARGSMGHSQSLPAIMGTRGGACPLPAGAGAHSPQARRRSASRLQH